MNNFKFEIFTFSPQKLRTHVSSFLLFKPLPVSKLKATLPAVVILIAILGVFDFISILGARILNINLLVAILDSLDVFFRKSFFFLFQVGFSIGVSKVYAFFLNEGDMKLSYSYLSLLSSVHLPLTLFLANVRKSHSFFSLGTALMMIQAFVSDYLSTSAVMEEKGKIKEKGLLKFHLISLTMHIVFYVFILHYMYSR